MLPKRFRISNKKQFQRVYQNGIKIKGKYHMMVGLFEKSNVLDETNVELGIIVGKKVAKHAVKRNLLKRQISSILYAFIKMIKLDDSLKKDNMRLTATVIAFGQIVDFENFSELEEDIKNVFSKLLKKSNYKKDSSTNNKILSENPLS